MSRTKIDVSLINPISSNLNMGSNKIVSLANGTASTDATAFGQVLGFRVLQVVQTTGGASISTTGTTFTTSNATLSITPTLSTSKILIIASSNVQTGTGAACALTIARNGSNLGDTTSGLLTQSPSATGNTNEFILSHTVWVFDSPATTSSTTYALYFRSGVAGQAVYCPPPTNTTASPDLGSTRIIAIEIG